ncbi:MAG: Crp/Fnr family transcriptional regulator [Bacteroidales bacterium]|nr:Crp/Fnr family transcriptional regulator [Bacteroidales bacterium]
MKITTEIESCNTCVYKKLLFDKLSDVEHKTINDTRIEYLFNKGEVLRKEGQKIQSFMYLRKGLVKIYKTDKYGKDHILGISRPGEFINLLSVFSGTLYNYSVAALEETQVCEIKLSSMKSVIKTNHQFALRLLNKISKMSEEIIDIQFELNQKQVRGRVAYVLLLLADRIFNSHEYKMPITRREVGEMISMTTENTIRTLSEFRKDGIIEITGKSIHIRDYQRLVTVSRNG